MLTVIFSGFLKFVKLKPFENKFAFMLSSRIRRRFGRVEGPGKLLVFNRRIRDCPRLKYRIKCMEINDGDRTINGKLKRRPPSVSTSQIWIWCQPLRAFRLHGFRGRVADLRKTGNVARRKIPSWRHVTGESVPFPGLCELPNGFVAITNPLTDRVKSAVNSFDIKKLF